MSPCRRPSPVPRRFLASVAFVLVSLPASAALQVTASAQASRVRPGAEVTLAARVQDPDQPGRNLGGVRWEALDGQVQVGEGVFRAPLTVLAARTFTLRATSLADARVYADVEITVDPALPEALTPDQATQLHALDMVEKLMGESKDGTWSHRGLPFLDVDTGKRYTSARLQSVQEEAPGALQLLPYGLAVPLRWPTPTTGAAGALLSIRALDGTLRFPVEKKESLALALDSRVQSATLEVLTRDGGGLHSKVVPLNAQVRGLVPLAGHPEYPGAEDGAQAAARFRLPSNLARHGALGLLVTDAGAHTVRTLTADGDVTTLCGLADQPGFADGRGDAARFRSPSFLALDPDASILVADTGNHAIRRILPDGTVPHRGRDRPCRGPGRPRPPGHLPCSPGPGREPGDGDALRGR